MTGFMKTMSVNKLRQITHISLLKAASEPHRKKKNSRGKESNKRKINERRRKNTDFPFNFWRYGLWREKHARLEH